MLRLYYRIWTDAISVHLARKKKRWEVFALAGMSLLQGMNLLVLLFVLHWLTHRHMPVVLPSYLFRARLFNVAATLLLTFFIPFMILNYLLVFYNKRYQMLLQRYPGNKGKLYRNYILVSFGLIVVPLVFKALFL